MCIWLSSRIDCSIVSILEIESELISYHKFNEKKNLPKIIDHLKNEKIISIISDAGTPSISDPGLLLINECVNYNIKVFPIPGPSAVIAAVSISGFSDQFYFYGFFPEKKQQLSNELQRLADFDKTLVFFVSPKKINKIIPEIKKNFSGRKILFCREISKFYEEHIRKNVDELQLFEKELKGEITVVISENFNKKINSPKLNESDMNIIKKMIKKFSIKEISNLISHNKKIPKKEIYNFCLKIKNEK